MKKWVWLTVIYLCVSTNTWAHTWDEPWHDDVVSGATSFGLFKVQKALGARVQLSLIEHLAGQPLPTQFTTSDFYLYTLRSFSQFAPAHSHDVWVSDGLYIYAYVQKAGDKFHLATPTAGYDEDLGNGFVAATYRHSLHKTQVDKATYEATQVCIFKVRHQQECDPNTIARYLIEPLKSTVAELAPNTSEQEMERFFAQHAALETAYLTQFPLPEQVLAKFLSADFFHVQVSAVRALAVSDASDKIQQLIHFAENDSRDGMARVMAIIMLDKLNATEAVDAMTRLSKTAPVTQVYLGGDIMDPRVSTWYPDSVRAAALWFLSQQTSHSE